MVVVVVGKQCSEDGGCSVCEKAFRGAPAGIDPCVRETLSEVRRRTPVTPPTGLFPREATLGRLPLLPSRGPVLLFVAFSELALGLGSDAPPLCLTLYECNVRGRCSVDRLGFGRDVPSHPDFVRWVEGQSRAGAVPSLSPPSPFAVSVGALLRAYVQGSQSLPRHDFIRHVCLMTAWYKICAHETFYCVDAGGVVRPLPLPAQATMRGIARSAFGSLEETVLAELDRLLAPKTSIRADERVALWTGLWQLILLYGEMARLERRAEGVLVALCVFYHGLFRNVKGLVEISLDWLRADGRVAACGDEIKKCFEQMKAARVGYYEEIRKSHDRVDMLFEKLAVEHERRKLRSMKGA